MSLVNEALKNARIHTGNGSNDPPMGGPFMQPHRAGGGSLLSIVVVALVVLCLALVAVLTAGIFVWHKASTRGDEQAALARPESAPTMMVQTQVEMPLSTPGAAASLPPLALGEDPGEPSLAPPPIPLPTPAPVVAPAPPPPVVVSKADPPDAGTGPEIAPPAVASRFKLKGIMEGKKGRMALINAQIAYVGDDLAGGCTVVEITSRHVVVEVNGKPYRLLLYSADR